MESSEIGHRPPSPAIIALDNGQGRVAQSGVSNSEARDGLARSRCSPVGQQRREVNNYARLREANIENRYTYRRCRDRIGIKGVYFGVSSINRFSTGFQACHLLLVYLQHEVHRSCPFDRPCRRCSGETPGNGVARADEGRIGGGRGGSRDRGERQAWPPGGCGLHGACRLQRLHRSGRVHGCLQVSLLRGVHRLPVLRCGLHVALRIALLRSLNPPRIHSTTALCHRPNLDDCPDRRQLQRPLYRLDRVARAIAQKDARIVPPSVRRSAASTVSDSSAVSTGAR